MTVDTSTEAVEKLLDGVTPGDWFSDGYRVEDFIPAARDLVPALLAERDALKAEVERLSKTLEAEQRESYEFSYEASNLFAWIIGHVDGASDAELEHGGMTEYWNNFRHVILAGVAHAARREDVA